MVFVGKASLRPFWPICGLKWALDVISRSPTRTPKVAKQSGVLFICLVFNSLIHNCMENQNQSGQAEAVKSEVARPRKTLDQYLGINGLCTVAIIGTLIKGALAPIGAIAGISAIYYLVKKRKELSRSQKFMGWFLVIVWLVLFELTSASR